MSRLEKNWPGFSQRRKRQLLPGLDGPPVEKVAENIVQDLFSNVLDWPLNGVKLQVGRADVILSDKGIKRLVLEVKRPGSLIGKPQLIRKAVGQALGYAAMQKVRRIAVSDGTLLYAADIVPGGLRDRAIVALDAGEPPDRLWWIAMHGIYRDDYPPALVSVAGAPATDAKPVPVSPADELLHPRYQLPYWCFAYIEDATNWRTWKLPYLLATGEPDSRRLPGAINSIVTNYRGEKATIPEVAASAVMVRLAQAAAALRKLPCQCIEPARAYKEIHDALDQQGRLADVGCCL